MAFDDDMESAGCIKVLRDSKYFEVINDDWSIDDLAEIVRVDCKGNPVEPHVWIPEGRKFLAYKDDELSSIENKIANKLTPDIEIGVATIAKDKI